MNGQSHLPAANENVNINKQLECPVEYRRLCNNVVDVCSSRHVSKPVTAEYIAPSVLPLDIKSTLPYLVHAYCFLPCPNCSLKINVSELDDHVVLCPSLVSNSCSTLTPDPPVGAVRPAVVSRANVSLSRSCASSPLTAPATVPLYERPRPAPPQSDMSKQLAKWKELLTNDPDSDYLLEGIEFGFRIVDSDIQIPSSQMRNYRSCTVHSKILSEEQIKIEFKENRYIISPDIPHVISAMGAVPKQNKKIRLIHDFSRPDGGLNALTSDTSVVFSSIDDAVKLIEPGSFIAKVDLKSAYRSVPIHPDCYAFTGLSWIFEGDDKPTHFFDCRLPFGASRSCRIFQAISNALVRIMGRKNYKCVSYIDDFLVIGSDKSSCQAALDYLLEIIPSLGLEVNFDKVDLPSEVLTFLGVKIDCASRTLALPDRKLAETKLLIKESLRKRRFTKKDLQRLIGKLSWCSRVVLGGRTFLRNLINLMTALKKATHHSRLNSASRSDLVWWDRGLELFHGFTPFPSDVALPSFQFSTDACLSGGGAAFRGDWLYVSWLIDYPSFAESHINVLELLTVLVAAERWAPQWAGLHIVVRSDNMAAVAAINKGTSRSIELLSIIQKLFWLSVRYNFKLTAAFLPGRLNILSDSLSRLHEKESAVKAHNLLSSDLEMEASGHLSFASYLWLQDRWMTD